MKTKDVAEKAQPKETELEILRKTMEDAVLYLDEISGKLSSKVNCTRFHFPDKNTDKETIVSYLDLKFLPAVKQKFVFDFRAEDNLQYLVNETTAEYKKRNKRFIKKYLGKDMYVLDTYYKITTMDDDKGTDWVDHHVILSTVPQ